jgi:type IV pilus assembly protein PilA
MKKSKAFTLIELLVVVAIIGILAAVGVVAYNGYTASAKANAVKAMHKQTAKLIANEMYMCNLGETTRLNGKLNCSNVSGTIGYAVQEYFKDQKNLYKTNLRAVTNAIGQSWNSDNDSNIGDILIKTANSGSQIHLTTCVKLSCKDPTNVLNDYISFDQ